MPTNMGGCGVYDVHSLRGAAYAASVIKNWPLLQRISPALHGAGSPPATCMPPRRKGPGRRGAGRCRDCQGGLVGALIPRHNYQSK